MSQDIVEFVDAANKDNAESCKKSKRASFPKSAFQSPTSTILCKDIRTYDHVLYPGGLHALVEVQAQALSANMSRKIGGNGL